MNIEQIKKELKDYGKGFGATAGAGFYDGANHVLITYYTPLDASHRELVEALQVIKKELFSTFGVSVPSYVETVLSNAKKLI